MTKKNVKKKNVKSAANKAKKEAMAKLQQAKKKFMLLEKQIKTFVKKNPGKAALIASAAVAALGTGVYAILKKKKK